MTPPRRRSPAIPLDRRGRSARRRGVTLIEMLVSVALLVLVMTILVTIFRAATGAMSAAQSYEALDQNLRRLDTVLRADLNGVTAHFTPPLNPNDGLGYFEYGENALSDFQGDDADDYIAFTSKAPEGQPFVGRLWIPNGSQPGIGGGGQLVSVTSNYAEVIYFLRNGNLYRRVLLIAPERGPSVQPGRYFDATATPSYTGFQPGGGYGTGSITGPPLLVTPSTPFGTSTSWQGLNDLSCHPTSSGVSVVPIPNTLGDLTNRHNRFARPRFYNDFVINGSDLSKPANIVPDGQPDDENYDPNGVRQANGIPDYYPTLYPNLFSSTTSPGLIYEPSRDNTATPPQVPPSGPATRFATYDTMPFPYIFPGMYSRLAGATPSLANVPANHPSVGAIHTLDPTGASYNQSPLEEGDSLAIPAGTPNSRQTWWGFPTWRETMFLSSTSLATSWTDPILRTNVKSASPPGVSTTAFFQNPGLSWDNPVFLPPVTDQLFNDTAELSTAGASSLGTSPVVVWQDDLLISGVRSFDVKAYDNSPRVFDPGTDDSTTGYYALTGLTAGYYDLGYEEAYFTAGVNRTPPNVLGSFAHEGRIPPRLGTTLASTVLAGAGGYRDGDNRVDPQYPIRNNGDNAAGVLRLRRVWDSWSTDYTHSPSAPVYPGDGPPFSPPPYPSYPAPYPAPLRAIQIQIRLADPRGQYAKTLTIRQDFTDKL